MQNTPNRRLKPTGKMTSAGRVRKINTGSLNHNSQLAMNAEVSPESRTKTSNSRANILRSAATKRTHASSAFARNIAESAELTNVVLTQTPSNILAVAQEIENHERDLERNISSLTEAKNREVTD